MINGLKKLGIERMHLNIVKGIHDKSVANIKLNEEILESLPLELKMRQGCALSSLLFNIILEFLARK
jgi:hypothetical protein